MPDPRKTYKERHKLLGLCIECSEPTENGTLRCTKHLKATRARGRKNERRRAASRDYRYYRSLVRYGISKEQAREVAIVFARPSESCAICGLPQYLIYRFHAEERWPKGGERHWQRLHLDHIDPLGPRDDLSNIRLLCYHCNHLRSRGRFTDEQVRRVAWHYWLCFLPERQLKWLKKPKGFKTWPSR